MKRRLLALLPLILTLASLVMWVRSQYAGDMWDFPARPVSGPDPGWSTASGPWTGWRLRRAVGSSDGRIVFVTYEEPTWRVTRPAATGYSPAPASLANGSSCVLRTYEGATEGRIPVAEWAASPRQSVDLARRRFVSVSWLVPAFIGAVAPAAWLWRRRRHGAAFPVVQPPA
jgi:hypothetical protein